MHKALLDTEVLWLLQVKALVQLFELQADVAAFFMEYYFYSKNIADKL